MRDDGSSDKTWQILTTYAQSPSRRFPLKLLKGDNIGVCQSFMQLLVLSSPQAQYLAWCDQDDIWLPNKISQAVTILKNHNNQLPLLYCSRLAIVDKDLKLIKYSDLPKRELSFSNALVEGMAWGATTVLNQAACRLLAQKLPQHAYYSDWWAYITISAFGQIVYDEKVTILYRRHSTNTSDFTTNRWQELLISAQRFFKIGHQQRVLKQAEEFMCFYGNILSEKNRDIIRRFIESNISLNTRLRYIIKADIYRQSLFKTLIMKILFLINRL